MSKLYTFPEPDETTVAGDDYLIPGGKWVKIPLDCLGQKVGDNVVRREVKDTIPTDNFIESNELIKEIRKTAENLSNLFGINFDE